jgi:hypothetical protein
MKATGLAGDGVGGDGLSIDGLSLDGLSFDGLEIRRWNSTKSAFADYASACARVRGHVRARRREGASCTPPQDDIVLLGYEVRSTLGMTPFSFPG